MTALLTADEAARLRPGEQLVIVRAGDPIAIPPTLHKLAMQGGPHNVPLFVAPQSWVALTGLCPHIGMHNTHGDCHRGRRIEPLYTECPKCHGEGILGINLEPPDQGIHWCDCAQGRVLVGRGSIKVVPVVTADGVHDLPMPCIEVFKVIDDDPANDKAIVVLWWQEPGQEMVSNRTLSIDALPRPGVDFGIVIDCVEVADGQV